MNPIRGFTTNARRCVFLLGLSLLFCFIYPVAIERIFPPGILTTTGQPIVKKKHLASFFLQVQGEVNNLASLTPTITISRPYLEELVGIRHVPNRPFLGYLVPQTIGKPCVAIKPPIALRSRSNC